MFESVARYYGRQAVGVCSLEWGVSEALIALISDRYRTLFRITA
ncbi:MAG: hypothetical protein AAFO06_11085 [Cyanobacteria bacterium J06597_16]